MAARQIPTTAAGRVTRSQRGAIGREFPEMLQYPKRKSFGNSGALNRAKTQYQLRGEWYSGTPRAKRKSVMAYV